MHFLKRHLIAGGAGWAGQVRRSSKDAEPRLCGTWSRCLNESGKPSSALPDGSDGPVGFYPIDKWEQRLDNDNEQVARR